MQTKENEPIKVICGTPCYMAPELVDKKSYNGQKVDVWAIGIILVVMLCGYYPFRGRNNLDLSRRIKDGFFNLP